MKVPRVAAYQIMPFPWREEYAAHYSGGRPGWWTPMRWVVDLVEWVRVGGEDRPKLTRVGDPKGYPTHLEAALALVEILQVEVDEQAIAVAIAREGMGG
jgi:hypothetical protein